MDRVIGREKDYSLTHNLKSNAFGIGPRTWLEKLTYRKRDRVLIALGVMIFLTSLALSLLGVGQFWIPAFLLV